jgi:DNA uptake protein ComE-like DNA-binding protein
MGRVPWWVWVSATPFGLGAWTPVVPGVALRRPLWIGLGLLWALVALAGWAAAIANDGGSAAGGLIILGWIGAIATTLAIRPAFNRTAGSQFSHEREAAERRLRERREAQQLALENPALAVELGVGRPDRPGARSAGLVDVNNAPLEALRLLPGIDEAKAMKIVRLREELNGFASLHDLGAVLELDGHAVERLRDDTVFLPR